MMQCAAPVLVRDRIGDVILIVNGNKYGEMRGARSLGGNPARLESTLGSKNSRGDPLVT
jgi:hypothetical protein